MSVSELGTRKIIRYTLGDLNDLNAGETLDSSKYSELTKMFESFNELDKRRQNAKEAKLANETVKQQPHIEEYLNKHNRYLYSESKMRNKRSFIKQSHVYSDQRIIQDIRKVINCVQKHDNGKVKLSIKRMNELSIPPNQAANVAKLFHNSMIECDFLIDEYMDVLLGFNNTDDEKLMYNIYCFFLNCIIQEFTKPSKFKDTDTETSADKEYRWRSRNAIIIAKLYTKNLEKRDLAKVKTSMQTNVICVRFLEPIFSQVSNTDQNTIQLLISVWNICAPKLQREHKKVYDSFIDRIQAIIDDPEYKMTDKVRLMNLLPE